MHGVLLYLELCTMSNLSVQNYTIPLLWFDEELNLKLKPDQTKRVFKDKFSAEEVRVGCSLWQSCILHVLQCT